MNQLDTSLLRDSSIQGVNGVGIVLFEEKHIDRIISFYVTIDFIILNGLLGAVYKDDV